MYEKLLTPEKALVFRIVHVANLPWILDNGLHCRNSEEFDRKYVSIGNAELINCRCEHVVDTPPGGNLSDYVPFYFTPSSIMLLNILTGRNVPKRAKDEIVILVASLRDCAERAIPFLFTDRHAYVDFAEYFSDLDKLDRLNWPILRQRDFSHDPENPGKKEEYQAEALIYRHVPVDLLRGGGCHSAATKARVDMELEKRGLDLDIKVIPQWFF